MSDYGGTPSIKKTSIHDLKVTIARISLVFTVFCFDFTKSKSFVGINLCQNSNFI